MRRSYRFEKGQWFFISAVIASGIFLSISVAFRGYFSVDNSVASVDENFYLSGIKDGIISSIKSDTDCTGKNLDEFIHFAADRMERMGHLLNVTKKSALNCAPGNELNNFHLILLQSPRMQVWDGVRPEITGIESVSLNVAKIKLKSALPYDVTINVSLFGPDTSVETESKKIEFNAGQTDKTVNFGTSIAGKEIRLLNPIIMGRAKFVVL